MKNILETIKRHTTFPAVISMVALFVALSGSAYAVTQLPKDSVGSSQIKSGAVKSSELGSYVKSKLRKVGATGETGPRGLQGVAGQKGQDGARGTTGPTGPAGSVNWAGVYEVTATRTGSGTATATCSGNDQVLSAFWYANSDARPLSGGRGNGGRSFGYNFSAPGGGTSISVVATCAPN